MQTANLSQNPQIEGSKSQQLFNATKINTMQYIFVKNRVGNEITLSAGAAHGLTENSRWLIFPCGTKHASPENKLGSVIIKDVHTITSSAEIVEEKDCQIQAGCRAVEELHNCRNKRKSVYIENHSTEVAQVKRFLNNAIKDSSWLRIADAEADFVVSLRKSKPENSSNNGFQIKILQAGNTQFLLQIDNPTSNDLLKIRRNLEALSKYSMVLELENPASQLRDFVEFTLLKKIDGQWFEAKPDYNDLPTYFENEPLAFRLINNSSAPIYVSILDLDLTKKIGLLYPPGAASERVGSRQATTAQNPDLGILQVGIFPNEKIMLVIPETIFLTEFSDINKKGGIRVFKLIATTEQTDFSWLQQNGMPSRRIRSVPSLPEELLYRCLIERRIRGDRLEVNKSGDWLTINRGFYLLKR